MKRVIIALIVWLLAVLTMHVSAQNVKLDKSGNYVAVSSGAKESAAKPTGKTFTDAKGNVYPVFISERGKLFVIRTSKSGTTYKQYLKI